MFKCTNKVKWNYPEIDYLNNAIRFLLKDITENNILAIQEICYAITKTKGYFHEDIKNKLIEYNIYNNFI